MLTDSVSIVVLTYNAEPWASRQIAGLVAAGVPPSQVTVIDSASRDKTRALFEAFGACVIGINQSDFNHGGTRRMAATLLSGSDILVYMTQDAIPADAGTIRNMLASFTDPAVGMAYGRQLPRVEAGAIEAHARHFNYPDASTKLEFGDRARIGTKVTFASDSFAAYRTSALMQVGNFPEDAFFAEDQIVAARMLEAGFKKAYVADARVYHSHSYTLAEDFRRCFDVGVFHARNGWLTETFGKPEGEGLRFVKSELGFVLRREPLRILEVMLRTILKYSGYKIGTIQNQLSLSITQKLSASPYYWTADRATQQHQRAKH